MNHDEIWDDSALIESWNDALAEYKKYHSIHATGGSVKDLPQPTVKDGSTDGDQPMEFSGEVEAAHETPDGSQTMAAQKDEARSPDSGGAPTQQAAMAAGLMAGSGMPGPQTILGSMQDEGLKKLLMSWYYAGYYTGLYEGQQQGKQQSQADQGQTSDEAQ